MDVIPSSNQGSPLVLVEPLGFSIEEPGEPGLNEASKEDAAVLVSEAFFGETSPLVRRWYSWSQSLLAEEKISRFELNNIMRAYVLFPIGSWSPADLEKALDATDAKLAPTLDEGSGLEQRRHFILMAGHLQEKLKASYIASGKSVPPPSTFDFSTGEYSTRAHWAAGTEAFESLPESERRWLESVDFNTEVAPFDLFSVMSLGAEDHGTATPEQPHSHSSLKESLLTAPNMGEVTPGMARSVMNDHKFSNLIPGQKPESTPNKPLQSGVPMVSQLRLHRTRVLDKGVHSVLTF